MTVKVGSARIDERGSVAGGQAGDQTGKEVMIENGYIKSYWKGTWDVCIRIKNKTKRKKYLDFIKWACANANIGYDQGQRLTLYNALKKIGFKNYKQLKSKVECDCSSLVSCGLIVAGFTKINPANTTRSLENDIRNKYPKDFSLFTSGYKKGDHTRQMTYWRNGDIINKWGYHVVTVVSGGRYEAVSTSYYKKYNGHSSQVDEVLKAIGVPDKYIGSVEKRTSVAGANNISNYKGTEIQNLKIIALAQAGKLKKV